MRKAFLILDMPEYCIDCPCNFAGMSTVVCGVNKKQLMEDDIETYKPDWCPLRELPEKNVENNKNYEAEINKLALIIQEKPEVLKMLLRNYDELVKKVYLPEIQESMKEYPFWNYFYVFDDELLKGKEG